uniref:Uncharacterized protein n=1 Tax=viral metagenome TaxID=1070528 RepID=A0A6C0KRG3_9ZZZZ
MDYVYLIKENANKNIELKDLENNKVLSSNNPNILNFLCYHISNESKYPFIQFMMEKIPYCNNFIKEQFILPYILFYDYDISVENLIKDKIKISLHSIGCSENMDNVIYNGIIFDKDETPYALIDISNVDITRLNLFRNSSTWFLLPSEIINTKSVCNLNIEDEVINLFTKNPELSILNNKNTMDKIILPEAVYSGGEKRIVEFNSFFGLRKNKVFNSCSEYYYFYKSFSDSVKEGGWINDESELNDNERIKFENNFGRYKEGGINRYALFIEGEIHFESLEEFSLTDEEILNRSDPCILICYTGEHEIKPNILVKKYENFIPLSYHMLNNALLDETFIKERSNMYMIK